MTDWIPDLLGDGYEQHTIALGADPDGEGVVEATLVRHTPPEAVAKYRLAVRRAVASEEVRKKLLDAGLEMAEGDPAVLAATMQKEFGQWQKIVKDIGFVAD